MRTTAENRRHAGPPPPGSAFTLVEMLVVLGILSMLLGATVPFLVTFMQLNDMDRTVSTVKMTAVRARALAVERRQLCDLVFTPSVTGYDEEGRPERNNPQADVADLVWLRLVPSPETRDRSMQQVTAGEPRDLPQNCRLVLGAFGNTVESRPLERYVTFASTGSLVGGTDTDGFYVIGKPEYEGIIQSVSASGDELTVQDTPWSGREDAFKNYYVVVLYDPDEIPDDDRHITGQARLIDGNDNNSLTLAGKWEQDSDGDYSAYSNQPFVIVTPDNIRNVRIYSTTGQVRAGQPGEATQ